jgi:hypothetical protein
MSLAFAHRLDFQACASLTGRPLPEIRRHLQELTEAMLLTENTHGHFWAHSLVRTYARELCHRTDSPAERDAAISRLAEHDRRNSPSQS